MDIADQATEVEAVRHNSRAIGCVDKAGEALGIGAVASQPWEACRKNIASGAIETETLRKTFPAATADETA